MKKMAAMMSSRLLLLLLLSSPSWCALLRQSPKECDEARQKSMQTEFRDCLNRHSQKHHEDVANAKDDDDRKDLLCKMLSGTQSCGNVWRECHGDDEIQALKDMHIQAWLQQYEGQREGEMARRCDVIKEYLQSGRAEQKAGDEETCTVREVSAAQNTFQQCSYGHSQEVWEEIQGVYEKRDESLRKRYPHPQTPPAQTAREKEDFLTREVLPRLCRSLDRIAVECRAALDKCFTKDDAKQMNDQNLVSMRDYYSKNFFESRSLAGCERNRTVLGGETRPGSPVVATTTTARTTTTTTTTTTTAFVWEEDSSEDSQEEEEDRRRDDNEDLGNDVDGSDGSSLWDDAHERDIFGDDGDGDFDDGFDDDRSTGWAATPAERDDGDGDNATGGKEKRGQDENAALAAAATDNNDGGGGEVKDGGDGSAANKMAAGAIVFPTLLSVVVSRTLMW